LHNFGTVAPGNSVGTLTVNGNYVAEPGSTHAVEIDSSGNADVLKVTGTATLNGGEVDLLTAPGFYQPGQAYTIVDADGGVSGSYDSVATNSLAFLDAALEYDPNAVKLGFTRNNTSFASFANTPNQNAAAAGAASAAGSPAYAVVASLDTQTASTAFDALSGEFHASRQGALLHDSRYLRRAVSQRLEQACVCAAADGAEAGGAMAQCIGSVWLHPYGDWGRTSGDGN